MHAFAAGERVRGLHDGAGRGAPEQGREAAAHQQDRVHAVRHHRPAHHALFVIVVRNAR